ncbi:hypothetical protein KX02_1863 (plasmid) [Francisella tularensis subsp. novicida]|nr:hypothetical protein KX02_1863 [Francisella tularensis subsp. novicida]
MHIIRINLKPQFDNYFMYVIHRDSFKNKC